MVSVDSRRAAAFLASPPDGVRLFLFHGSDAGAVSERARQVERIALERGGGDAVLRFGSDEISSDPGRIADEAYSASLFGGEPVIALRVLDGRHNVLGAIEPLLARPPDAAWLIVEAGELAKTSALRKAFEASSRAAAIVSYPLDAADLPSFIRQAAEEAGRMIEPEAVELLAEVLGGDRLAMRSELDKLFTYVGDAGSIGAADVAAIVGDTAESRIDGIIDAALLGDSEGLETGLARLLSEGGSASGLGTQTLRHLLQLQGLRAAMDGGVGAGPAIDRHRPPIFARRQRAVAATLAAWSSEALREARRKVGDAVLATRLRPTLESAAISAALHELALEARRVRRVTKA
jgi:DNA polymerase-3 subunit delta